MTLSARAAVRGAVRARGALLLVEPDFVLRRTVASVATTMDLADVHEAASLDKAAQMLRSRAFDALVISTGGVEREVLLLLRQLRAGETGSARDAKVALLMTPPLNAELVPALRELQVGRIVLKPFKVKTILETMAQFLAPQAAPA